MNPVGWVSPCEEHFVRKYVVLDSSYVVALLVGWQIDFVVCVYKGGEIQL